MAAVRHSSPAPVNAEDFHPHSPHRRRHPHRRPTGDYENGSPKSRSTKEKADVVPRVVVPRSAEQSSRLLLSNAFRYDTMETEQNRKHIQETNQPLLTVKLELVSLYGALGMVTTPTTGGGGGGRKEEEVASGTTLPAGTPKKEKWLEEEYGMTGSTNLPERGGETTAEAAKVEDPPRSDGKKSVSPSKWEKKETAKDKDRSLSKKKEKEKKEKHQKGEKEEEEREGSKEKPQETTEVQEEEGGGEGNARKGLLTTTTTPPRGTSASRPTHSSSLSASPPIEVNLAIFDPILKLFVTAAYRLPLSRLEEEPVVFQATPRQLLVVELLSSVRIPPVMSVESLDRDRRVIAWAAYPVSSLEHHQILPLRAGNAQLLYMDRKCWPLEASPTSKGKELGGLECRVEVGKDRALTHLMTELVPPGLIVPYAFAMDTPHPRGSTFEVEIEAISLQPSSRATEVEREALGNTDTQWSIAVIAHNGYQQLTKGEEVPLRIPRRRRGRKEKARDGGTKVGKRERREGSQGNGKEGSGSPLDYDHRHHRGGGTGLGGSSPTVSLYSAGSYSSYDHTTTTSTTSSSLSSPTTTTTTSSNDAGIHEVDKDGAHGGHSKERKSRRKPTSKAKGDTVERSPKKQHFHNTSHTTTTAFSSPHHYRTKPTVPWTPWMGLESAYPLVLPSLPIHASTSLVLAIRRRRLVGMTTAVGGGWPSTSSAAATTPPPSPPPTEVLGFCVFPLCLLPMKDRDLRVENLPALQGPFSCQDARLLVADSKSPYGQLPFTITLSLTFRGTKVPGERSMEEDRMLEEYLKRGKEREAATAGAEATPTSTMTEKVGSQKSRRQEETASKKWKTVGEEEDEDWTSTASPDKNPKGPSFRNTPEGSEERLVETVPAVHEEQALPTEVPRLQESTAPMPSVLSASTTGGPLSSPKLKENGKMEAAAPFPGYLLEAGGESIFEMLHRIMKELHEVRIRQDELFDAMARPASPHHLSPALQARVNARLVSSNSSGSSSSSSGPLGDAPGVTIIDLRPVAVAVPWQVRQQMTEAAQPIPHPVLPGHTLCDFARAERQHTRSLFGFRLEGLTLDAAFPVPEDLCFLFSFGPLPFQKVGPARTIEVSSSKRFQGTWEGPPLMNIILNRLPREEAAETVDSTPDKREPLGKRRGAIQQSVRFVDTDGRGGFVWMEPVDPTVFHVPLASMESFKQYHAGRAVLYLHLYDALTMFYLCTAPIPYSHFYRPYHSEAALIPMDLPVQRDLSMTAQPVPESVFPLILHAGQLHLTLVCVGAPPISSSFPASATPEKGSHRLLDDERSDCLHRLVEPQNGSRLVFAKKLPSTHLLGAGTPGMESSSGITGIRGEETSAAGEGLAGIAVAGGGTSRGGDGGLSENHRRPSTGFSMPAADGVAASLPPPLPPPPHSSILHHRHWQRAQFFKNTLKLQRGLGSGATPLPGVPDEHVRSAALRTDPVTMEYRLRLMERERDIAKSRAITTALKERITVRHELYIASWRPEVLHTPFENPFHTAATFSIDIPPSEFTQCTTTNRSLTLAPKERSSIPLVVRLHDKGLMLSASYMEERRRVERAGGGGGVEEPDSAWSSPVVKLLVKVYAPQRQLIRVIEIRATILPPQVDRRLEIFGPAGVSVTKNFFSREYSSSLVPDALKKTSSPDHDADAISRLYRLCAAVTCSSPETTTAKTVAMLDPITQYYVTAWEEVVLTTTIPSTQGEQRIEYLTLYQDASCTQTLEVWELCVFPCFVITTREIPWGQTTTIALPADQSEDLYCSSSHVKVERHANSYLLHISPTAVGNDRMVLHTLQQDALVKTLLTVPVVYPTPTATQVIELSMEDLQHGPVQRRLTFFNRGEKEDFFTIRQNYTYQLYITPSRFLLAPGDAQPIHLRIGPLALPDGQSEGRWPMWMFINNSSDKTIESYYLQVVLRLHTVVPHVSGS